jgi:hypothetical protein
MYDSSHGAATVNTGGTFFLVSNIKLEYYHQITGAQSLDRGRGLGLGVLGRGKGAGLGRLLDDGRDCQRPVFCEAASQPMGSRARRDRSEHVIRNRDGQSSANGIQVRSKGGLLYTGGRRCLAL